MTLVMGDTKGREAPASQFYGYAALLPAAQA